MDGASVEAVRAELARLLASAEIGGSERLRSLLTHLVEETLAGRSDRLKGSAIAISVFGRGGDFDPSTDAVVRTEARRLRQALASYYIGEGAGNPLRITVPKGSYVPRFEPVRDRPLQPAPDPAETADAATAPPAAERPAREPPPVGAAEPPPAPRRAGIVRSGLAAARGRRVGAAAILLVLLLSSAVFGPRFVGDEPSTETVAPPSVLVLPFDVAGAETEARTLADGLTAELVADLMRFPDIRLYSLGDSLRQEAGAEVGALREDLGAAYVVRGTIRSEVDRLAVAARLVDASDGRVVWSDVYTEPLEPLALIDVQSEIAGAIASAIGQPYGAMRTELAGRVTPTDVAMSSYSCVLSAYTYRHRNRSALYEATRACLEEAVVRDPAYAAAWAMLAHLRVDGGRFGYEATTEAEREAAYRSAREAAARALALDPKSVEGMKALSLVEHYSGRYEAAQRAAREAVALNPNDPNALGHLGFRLTYRGKFEEGIPYIERAIARSANPLPMYFHPIALERLMAGDMEGMLVAAERAAADGSSVSDVFLAIAHAGLGHREAAREALERMARKWPLLARDPAEAFRRHHVREDLIAAMVEGLRAAGWQPPERSAMVHDAGRSD